jgi:hypothetical protein
MTLVLILKSIGAPGSGSFLLTCGIAGLLITFLWPASRTIGRAWMLAVCGIYVLLSLPIIASAIANGLPSGGDRASALEIDTLIVLDGDNVHGRVRQAEKVFRSQAPKEIRVLGHSDLETELRDAGIPGSRIRLESATKTTREQMNRVRELADEGQLGRTAVLVSRVQAPRVAGLTRALHLDVGLIPSPLDRGALPSGGWRYVPSFAALWLSRDAIYEHVALAYYRRRGWIAREP